MAILDFSLSGLCLVSGVWFGFSVSNFMCMLFVAMDRSLLIISYVTFKIAIWQPYWIFWFLDSKFSLASKLRSVAHYWYLHVYRIVVILNDFPIAIHPLLGGGILVDH